MLGLSLAVLLAAVGIAAFPCWRHSAGWGYGLSTVAGGLLFLVAAFTVGERAVPHSQSATPARAPSSRAHAVVAQVEALN
ncbi:MAG: DUF3309 domain-containing protein [Reyranella sp.]|uniref:DUF3309 family protein n=1 Tax=Reyranella sp. TaxID=1929291 RepID=UPI001205EC5C|nr:hypothetical protein [Reyranella sp.]TAJ84429.1 MAG: DUF3309 domain-containing protein [Reyranella sp.]TBR28106.1 MAG: DUF3309 domain-containing protein [Reyranella sp.]